MHLAYALLFLWRRIRLMCTYDVSNVRLLHFSTEKCTTWCNVIENFQNVWWMQISSERNEHFSNKNEIYIWYSQIRYACLFAHYSSANDTKNPPNCWRLRLTRFYQISRYNICEILMHEIFACISYSSCNFRWVSQ